MRVSIEHKEEKTGLIRRKTIYDVLCKVEFSEEEKQIIKQRRLGEYVILNWPVNEAHNDLKWCAERDITANILRIEHLLKGAVVHLSLTRDMSGVGNR